MLLQGIDAHLEAIGEAVALDAVRRDPILGELTLVVVFVAARAGVERDWIRVRPLMALLAVHAYMLPLQREVGRPVIEPVHGAKGLEALLLVALRALGAELSFVRVLVAGGAVVLLHAQSVLEHRQRITGPLVAFEAVRGGVLADQPEVGRIMVEPGLPDKGLEGLVRVALRARVREVRLVRVAVARFAIGMGQVGELLELLAVTGGNLVALLAIDLRMSATQGEVGLRMVELPHRLPSRHVVAAAAIL